MLRKLFSQTAIYGISAILTKFVSFVLLAPYLTRIMGTDTYGEVNVYYSIIPVLNVILTMGLATGYFRFAAKCETELQKRELFSTVWAAVSVFSILFFILVLLFADSFNMLLNLKTRWVLIVTAGVIMVDNINAIPLAALRQQSKAKSFLAVNLTNVTVNLITCVALYSLIEGSETQSGWVMVANLAASCVSFVMLLPSSLGMMVRRFSKTIFRTISQYSFPLMIGGIMGVSSDFIDRVMLNWLLPQDIALSQVGIYSGVAKVAMIMVLFRQIYSLGAEPFFLQNFAKDDFRRINAQALKYFIIAGLGVFLGVELFRDLFMKIIGKNFREGSYITPILLLANLLAGIIINLSFWYKQVNKTHMAIYVTGIGLIITILLNLILIPHYGYLGAAWTQLAANFAMVVISYILGQMYCPISYDMKNIARYFTIALSLYVLSRYTSTLSVWLQYSANILLILSYLLIVYKLEWKKLKL